MFQLKTIWFRQGSAEFHGLTTSQCQGYLPLVQSPSPIAISRTSRIDINRNLFYVFYMLTSLSSMFSLNIRIHIDVELQIKTR